MRRQGLVNLALQGEADGVDRKKATKEGMRANREAAGHYALDNIFSSDETGYLLQGSSSTQHLRCVRLFRG